MGAHSAEYVRDFLVSACLCTDLGKAMPRPYCAQMDMPDRFQRRDGKVFHIYLCDEPFSDSYLEELLKSQGLEPSYPYAVKQPAND